MRTIGASIILIAVAVAGIIQIVASGDPGPVELAAMEPNTTMGDGSESEQQDVTTTAPLPFTYRVGVLSGISTDNFWAFYGEQPSVWNSYILGPTKPALFTAHPSLGTLEPELAVEAVEAVSDEDGWAVRLELRSDLAWSDGVPVTAHDMVFTFETVRRLALGGSWGESFPAAIDAIDAESDQVVRIEFGERPRLSVWPYGVGLAPIMARHVWEDVVGGIDREDLYAMTGESDVSGGPLAIVEKSETLIVSKANSGYPLADAPDAVEYHVYADESAAVAALAEGTIDSVLSPRGLTAQQLDVVDDEPGVEVITSPGHSIRYLGFNLDRDPMSDRAFRTALALLLDVASLSDSIADSGPAAWSLVPEANTEWFDSESVAKTRSRFDGPLSARLDAALAGLAAAGYEWEESPAIGEEATLIAGAGLTIDGRTPQPLTILTTGDAHDPARPEYVEAIAATLGALGFDARPVETDFDTVVDLAFTPGEDGALNYDMYLLGWTLGSPALPGYYGILFADGGPMNNTGYHSDAFAESLESYEKAFTKEAAFEALWEMEETLAIDLPYLPLYTSRIVEAYRSDRVRFDIESGLGGLQARLGAIRDVKPAD